MWIKMLKCQRVKRRWQPPKINPIWFLCHTEAWRRFNFLIVFSVLLFQQRLNSDLAPRILDVLLQAQNNTNRTWTLAVFSVCVTASVDTGFHIFVSFYKSWYSPDSCCSSPTRRRRRWCSVPTADREWGSSGRASWSAPPPALPISHTRTNKYTHTGLNLPD